MAAVNCGLIQDRPSEPASVKTDTTDINYIGRR